MGGNRIHQRRRQAGIDYNAEGVQPRANCPHVFRIGTRLDTRRDKGGKFYRRPSRLI